MSSHMAGGCPPRSAVASGPLKCELNFSAGSCAFGLFVTRRFGESERVSGPGATPPLAPSPVRIGSELSAAMPRSKEATSSKLFGCCAAHGHKQAPAKEQQAASARAHRSATRSEQRAHQTLKQLAKEDLELITPRGRYIGPIRQPPEETTYIFFLISPCLQAPARTLPRSPQANRAHRRGEGGGGGSS